MFGFLVPVGGGDTISLRQQEIVIGRKSSCDIVLQFGNISSQHCRLTLSSGYWYVEDLHSTNGVKVNGQKVQDRRLDPGDELTIAHHGYRIQYDPAKNGATGPPPTELLREDRIFSRSLLEKTGLEKPTARKSREMDSTRLDLPAMVAKTPGSDSKPSSGMVPSGSEPGEKRDFFDQLQFD